MKKVFLTVPINDSIPNKKYFIKNGDTILSDFDASICPDDPRILAYIDVTRFGDVSFVITDSENNAVNFGVSDRFPTVDEIPDGTKNRPAAHYTTTLGWTNDPNGLVYADGKYHMFYQHNPLSVNWGNMTWGHAVSVDLVHWEEVGDALFPDEMGTMFSGSAIVDENNAAGFGIGAILLFYTAAGGKSYLSKDAPFTQCLAYSTDGGVTFTKYDKNPILPHIIGENRDPKVQWCDELGKYTLSLFLDGHDYAIFTSSNLLDWEKWMDIHTPMDDECPDFYPLEVDGKRKWVFSGAHDTYIIGVIKDGKFIAEQEELPYHIGPGCSYAAQTFSGTGARRIKIPWGTNHAHGAVFNSQMGIPVEMFLRRVGDKIRLGSLPVKEAELLCKPGAVKLDEPFAFAVNDAVDVTIDILDGCGKFTVCCFGIEIAVDPDHNTYTHGGCTAPLSYSGEKKLRIIFDTLGCEVFADSGLIYSTFAKLADRSLGFRVLYENPPKIALSLNQLSMK